MILPITLTTAGAAALVNIWLAVRIGRVRRAAKVSVGDGGHDLLLRRMRAQANFTEYAPFVLILIALIELARGSLTWLWLVSLVFLLARVAHGFGMDGGKFAKLRMVGIVATLLILLGLAAYAIAIPYFSPALKVDGLQIA